MNDVSFCLALEELATALVKAVTRIRLYERVFGRQTEALYERDS